MIIRNERKEDYREVENLTREAFWNVHVPGANEHYLVHKMRENEDFISELDFVVEEKNKIIANIMYTKAKLVDENKTVKEVLTFGPLSVLPSFQRMGYAKKLMEHSFHVAKDMGYDTVVIFGNPQNYVTAGFKSSSKYNIHLEGGFFPTALLVKVLKESGLEGHSWTFFESSLYDISQAEVEVFDEGFPYREKEYKTSQELFYIYSHSGIVR